jgi:hypothetical protein
MSFLLFDASDDGQGQGTWEAMASVHAERLPQLMAEVQAALAQAERSAPGPRGPLDEGCVWDADVQMQTESDDQGDWTAVTLSLTGPWAWGEALVAELSSHR